MICCALILLILTPIIYSCGIAVHIGVAESVYEHSPQFDKRSYFAGTFFPDCFYNCFGLSEAAEEAHWAPFLKNAVKYWKEGPPDNQLKSFIYGMLTHQVADVAWHSLHMDEGLLKFIAETEYAGDVAKAHTFLDTGGDFLFLNKFYSSLLFTTPWKYPVKDIVDIFHRMGHIAVTAEKLELCMERGYAGIQSEMALVNTRTPSHNFIARSPLLDDVLLDYFRGGIQDLKASVVDCFAGLDSLFHGGSFNCLPLREGVENVETETKRPISAHPLMETASDVSSIVISPVERISSFGTDIVSGNFLGSGPCIAVSAPYDNSVYVIPLNGLREFQSYSLLGSKNIYSLFGTKLLSFPLGETDFLLVSDPGKSTVSVFYKNEKLLVITTSLSQFPFEMLLIEGRKLPNVLLLSQYAKDEKSQRGIARTINGGKMMAAISQAPGQMVSLEELTDQTYSLPSPFRAKGFEGFGVTSASSSDLLFIGARSLGAVIAYDKRNSPIFYIGRKFNGEIRRSKDTGSFGSAIVAGNNWVLISSSSEDVGLFRNAGRLYLYSLHPPKLVAKIDSSQEFSRLGYKTIRSCVDENIVYATAPGWNNNRGAVFKVDIITAEISHEPIFQGPQNYTGFGLSIACSVVGGKEVLALGLPYCDITTSGRVAIYTL